MNTQTSISGGKRELADVIRENRLGYLKRFVDLDGWKELSDKVENFAPDIVILQSRRMPRFHKVLQSQNILNIDAKFVSEFAIPYLRSQLKDKRIAIVDDTVNGGRTLKGTFDLIGDASEKVHAFVLLKRDGGGGSLDSGKITYIRGSVPECEYREASARTALALWLANEPFECEFPVFRLRNRAADLAWPEFLVREFGEKVVHRLDIPEAPFIGYARYSVDLAPDSECNDKLRIYEDLISGETVAVCMADVKGGVRERYSRATEMGKQLIREKLKNAGDWESSRTSLNLLFGVEGIPSDGIARAEAAPQDFMATHWPHIRKHLKPSWSLYDCFYNFFLALRNYMAPIQETSAVRLHIGPTFAQLLEIMGELWTPERRKGDLRFLLSQMLDEQIDRGFVVPEQGDDENRIFRKGEPAGNDTVIAQFLESIGVSVRPEEDLHAVLERLTEPQARRLEYLRRLSESL